MLQGRTGYHGGVIREGRHLNASGIIGRDEYLNFRREITIELLCSGMLFNCLRKPNQFPIRVFISSFVHVTGGLGGVMQKKYDQLVFVSSL